MTPSSAAITLLGSQRPRLENRPDSVGSHGDRVVKFAANCGVHLDDWQEYVLWALFDVDADNKWAANEFGLLVSRQNGKGEILVAYDLAHLFLFPRADQRRKTVIHTAHEVKTAEDGLQRLIGVVRSQDRLMDRVANIYTANGQEGIVLHPRKGQALGDRIRFIARSKNSGRGFAGDTMVYDEAQELAAAARDALTYTSSAVPNKQELYFGTAPSALNESDVFEGVRDRGRGGTGRRTGWMEWTPTGSEHHTTAGTIDFNDPDVWAESIPALGIRIMPETVEEQVDRATDPETLGQERFSVWPARRPAEEISLSDLDIEQFKANKIDDATVGEGPVIAIALGKGGGFGTVSIASRFDDDSIVIEHKKTERQTLWIPAYVAELKKEIGATVIVLDEKNATSILNGMKKKKLKWLSMNVNEIAGAHSAFIEYSNDGKIIHRGQDEVVKSLQFATVRKMGTAGYTWEPSDPTKPITQALSVTWAAWGVTKSEAAPLKTPAAVRGYS